MGTKVRRHSSCWNLRRLRASQEETVSLLQYRICLDCRHKGPGIPVNLRGRLAGLENKPWRSREDQRTVSGAD